MAMAAWRLFFPFHLRPSAAHPLATVSGAPHRRKHDAVACKSTGKTRTRTTAKDSGKWRPQRRELEEHLKRRTRSAGAFDTDLYRLHAHRHHHTPVLLDEVLAAFRPARSRFAFVDCTLGVAGHSLAMMEAHPEMELHIGMDLDPSAPQISQGRIEAFLASRSTDGGGGGDALQGTLRTARLHSRQELQVHQACSWWRR